MRTSLALPFPKQSTNVRVIPRPELLRSAFRALSWIAPGAATRWAADMFLTPPPPRPLSARMAALWDGAADRFAVKLETDFGGTHDVSPIQVAVWGHGPAVYLLHGWGGRGGQWVSFIEPIVAAGLTAVAPGHGDSPAPRTSILHFAAALHAVVESVGPARAVVGHSMGAAACAYALRGGLDAERGVLIGAPYDPSRFFHAFLEHIGARDRFGESVKASVEEKFGFRWSDLTVAPPEPRRELPALVLHDRDDLEVDYQDAPRIVAGWPGADLVTTTGLGHQRILRDRDVVERVTSFVATGSREPAPGR
jgi:pimeloyl-ACP methyl ester carboxylesterase